MAEEAEFKKTAVTHEVATQEVVDADEQDHTGKADATLVPQAENVVQRSDEEHVDVQKAPPLIQNGLRLQLRENSLPFAAYTYGTIPASVVTELDWTIIVSEDVTASGDHIRCHQLKTDENLNEVLAGYLYSEAAAIVLINSENNYNVVDEVQSEVCVPVLVLSSEEGQKLLQALENAEDNSVFAAVKIKGSKSIDLEPNITAEPMQPPSRLSLPSLPSIPQMLGNISVLGAPTKLLCITL